MPAKTYRIFTVFDVIQRNLHELEPSMSTQISPFTAPLAVDRPAAPTRDEQLLTAAQNLEASFLAEMLKSAGVGTPRETFGGGAGEEHFASFLRELRPKRW
jgi:hypothetical protein